MTAFAALGIMAALMAPLLAPGLIMRWRDIRNERHDNG